MPQLTNKKQNNSLAAYAGLASQFLVAIAAAVFGGYKFDKWLHISFPLATWLLPLLVIIAMLYKIFKDTSAKK